MIDDYNACSDSRLQDLQHAHTPVFFFGCKANSVTVKYITHQESHVRLKDKALVHCKSAFQDWTRPFSAYTYRGQTSTYPKVAER